MAEKALNSAKRFNPDNSVLGDILMVVLSLVSIALLIFEVVSDQTPQQQHTLEIADKIIAFIFLAEWCWRWAFAPNRKLFLKQHWWELLAALPISSEATEFLRGLNALRIIRVVRLLRMIRFLVRLKIILDASSRFAEQTHLVYIATLSGVVILASALGFHYLEAGKNPNIHGLWDCVWWAVVTVTTVGYGDIYPVTTGGRILAMFLMLGGIATVSGATAVIVANLINKK